jgi:hypothetical protein
MRRDSWVGLASKGGIFTGVGSDVGRDVGALLGIGVGSWRRTRESGKVQLQNVFERGQFQSKRGGLKSQEMVDLSE